MGLTTRKNEKNDVTDSVGLLISILVRYPEVATVNFDPDNRILRLTFIYSKVFAQSELNSFQNCLRDSLEVFSYLEGSTRKYYLFSHQTCESFTMIEVQRDVATLTKGEISLIVELFHDYFHNNLVTEEHDQLIEEDLIAQEEIIEHMLESIKCSTQDRYLFAFREEGKVMVFNKKGRSTTCAC